MSSSHLLLTPCQVDTLEIQLRESVDLVDHFFLVEATLTHTGDRKPILWERLRCAGSSLLQLCDHSLQVH